MSPSLKYIFDGGYGMPKICMLVGHLILKLLQTCATGRMANIFGVIDFSALPRGGCLIQWDTFFSFPYIRLTPEEFENKEQRLT